MANLKRVKTRIREIAEGNRKNITIEDIRWVVNNLKQNGYATKETGSGHVLFRVGNKRFGVCEHNPGSSHVKRCYVDDSIDIMIDLGLYEE
jgi:hypothetical protein